jgi:methionyl-tRNA synthetase
MNVHLIGKDILRFHAVYWPAMLMSAGVTPPEKVFGHGFLTKDGQKMGKSLGNTLDPISLVERYGADAVRYYFLREIEFGQDGDFNETRFVNVLNSDLANDFGNLLNRTLKMANKYCHNQTPNLKGEDIAADHPLKQIGENLSDRAAHAYNNLSFSQACSEIIHLVSRSNKYIDEQAPWSLYKQGEQKQVEEVIYTILESIRLSAYLLSPITPTLSTQIYQQLGFSVDFNDSASFHQQLSFTTHKCWGILPPRQPLGKAKPVFLRLELPEENPL